MTMMLMMMFTLTLVHLFVEGGNGLPTEGDLVANYYALDVMAEVPSL